METEPTLQAARPDPARTALQVLEVLAAVTAEQRRAILARDLPALERQQEALRRLLPVLRGLGIPEGEAAAAVAAAAREVRGGLGTNAALLRTGRAAAAHLAGCVEQAEAETPHGSLAGVA